MRQRMKVSLLAYLSLFLTFLLNELVFISSAQANDDTHALVVTQHSTTVRLVADTKGTDSEKVSSVNIAPTNSEQRFAEYVRIQSRLKSLSEDLRSPDRIVSRIRLLHPDLDPTAEIMKAAALQKDLREQQQRLLQQIRLPQSGEYEFSEARRPFRILNGAVVTESHLQTAFQALTPRCPDLILGQVKASAFRHYRWAEDVEHGYATIVYWPLHQRLDQVPSETFNGDWSGETGTQFLGQLVVTGHSPGWEFVAGAGVFQFTLPAPQCDSVVYWGTTGRVARRTPWTFDGEKATFWTEWVLHESPEGRGFPASVVSNFMWFRDGLEGGNVIPEGSWKTNDRQDFNRSFHVKAGVKARIYLGISLGMLADNGTVMTGLLDTLEFAHGVTYFTVPE